MDKNTKNTKPIIHILALTILCATSISTAQTYTNNSSPYTYGNSYGNSAYGYTSPLTYGANSYGAYGSAYTYQFPYNNYADPYTSYGGYTGYAGYGGYRYNSPVYVYRSPQSFDNTSDPYHNSTQTDLQRSTQRFRDLREDRQSRNNTYSNETYNRNQPHDAAYYNRDIR